MLPVKSPEQLVVLDGPGAFRGRTFNNGTFSYPMYRDFRDQNTVFDGVIARFPAPLTLLANGQAERVNGELVTGNYFDVLGVRAHIGRTFTPDDDRTPGGHPVAVLSHNFWMRRFGGDPGVLNRTISLNGLPMTIVGVTPRRLLRHRRRREPRRDGAGDDEGADDADLGRSAEPHQPLADDHGAAQAGRLRRRRPKRR